MAHDDDHIPPGMDLLPQGHLDASYRGAGHETQATRISGILYFAVALTVVTILIHVGLAVWLMSFSRDEARNLAERPTVFDDSTGQYPGPRLQDNPARDMANQTQREQTQLNSYSWAEPGKTARIPIDRAIALLVERGLPRPMAHRGAAPAPAPAAAPATEAAKQP